MKIIAETRYTLPNTEQGRALVEVMKKENPYRNDPKSWSTVKEVDTSIVLTFTRIINP